MSEPADLLVTAVRVVTMDDARTVWADGAVAVRDGVVAEVGPRAEVEQRWDARERVDGGDGVLLPGLINAHVHLTGPTLFPGAEPAAAPLGEHFGVWVLPPHVASEAADEVAAARLSVVGMLRTGTTAFLEAGVLRHPDAVARALAPMGVRGALGAWVSDRWPGPLGQRDAASAVSVLHEAGGRAAGLLRWPSVVGHDGCSDEVLVAAAATARERGTGWTLHLSAGPQDRAHFLQTRGAAPLVHLERIGVLDERCVIGHGTHLDDDEVAVLHRTGATVAHCPGAALRLCLGLAEAGRHPELPHVALGTDTPNTSNHSDVLRAAATSCDAYGAARGDRGAVTAERALEWATLGGARALGLAGTIGTLTPGARADLVLADCGPLVPHVANALVHGAPRVRHVWVDGRQLVRDGAVEGEQQIRADAVAAAARVRARSGLPATTGWPVRWTVS